jgi:hypothetical protein
MRTVFLLALLLTACGEGRPPVPTAEESERLNEAEAMLNEGGPATQAADPNSN